MVQLAGAMRAFCTVVCVIEAFGHYSGRSKEMGEEHGSCFSIQILVNYLTVV